MKRLLLFLAFAGAAFAQTHEVTLNWIPPSGAPAGTTYNAYRLTGACPTTAPVTEAAFTKINTAPIAASPYIDTAVTAGTAYCYVVTAVSGGTETGPSNDAAGVVPATFPPTALSAVAN